MKEPYLVVMAAGLGSRFGGPKQVEPVGEHGEILLDYSVFDAMRAGFRKVVFIVNEATEEIFREKIGRRMQKYLSVSYARQSLSDLPTGFALPSERKKPWGTAHAVLSCRDIVDAPFVVINADDYYGPESFSLLYQALPQVQDGPVARYLMAGYRLENTLTDNGHVARGVCVTDEEGFLKDITEHTYLERHPEGPASSFDEGKSFVSLPGDTTVSMNCWCFSPGFLAELRDGFPTFLRRTLSENPLKGEYFLPEVVNTMMREGRAKVRVLKSPDKWYGVTYRADKPEVAKAISQMTKEGKYPEKLWGE